MTVKESKWFHEINSQWPGQANSLQIQEVLHTETSRFQDLLVFQSTNHGNVLALDGVIQVTERDEFAYQEMMAHLPMAAHGNPQKVLVVGGGDGGILREIVKYDSLESVTLVEIDEAVIRVCKKYLPSVAVGFQHPKVQVVVGDGFEYLKANQASFDVIITDSSDPVGPAQSLFQSEYYELLGKALRPGGIVCCQGECIWLHLNLMKNVMDSAQKVFPVVKYAWASVPTYPSGQIGFLICSNDSQLDPSKPKITFSKEFETCKLKYYDSEIHEASFVLPGFARKVLENRN